jgi:hypothetical protein
MTKFKGKKATVNKPDSLVHGKKCVILEYHHDIRKYKVEFCPSWIGWFKLKELIIYKGLD